MITLPFGRTAAALAALALSPTSGLAREPSPIAPAAVSLDPAVLGAAVVVDRFHAALRSGELQAAAGLLADDALIFESGGVERGKAEYSSHHLAADSAFSKAVPSSIIARTGGSAPGIAWVATESRMAGSFKGKPLDRLSTETMLLRQSGDGWKIIHIHWSSSPAPRAPEAKR